MVESISSWAQGIIIAVIISTIIEMILPNSSKKYIRLVIGIFILLTIISPILDTKNLSFDSNQIKIDEYISSFEKTDITENIENQTNNQIKNLYKENLKLDIQSKIKLKGYDISNINIDISDDETYTLKKIELYISGKKQAQESKSVNSIVDNIQNIKVELSNSNTEEEQQPESILSNEEKSQLKKYISDYYEINENMIFIQ